MDPVQTEVLAGPSHGHSHSHGWGDTNLAHRGAAQSTTVSRVALGRPRSWRRTSRDAHVEAAMQASRGQQILGVDRNNWVFAMGHVLAPVLLYICQTHLTDAIHGALQLRMGSFLYTLSLLLTLGGHIALYRSLYLSDPGFVDAHSSVLIGPLGNPCPYCDLQPPLRSRHDFHTGQCVVKFDHFCHLLATPIGDCNHARFLAFVTTQTFLLVWGILLAWHSVDACFWPSPDPVLHHVCWRLASMRTLVLVLLLAALIAVLQAFAGLLVFHCYLAATNQTTYELLKGSKVPYLSPFFRVYTGPRHVVGVTFTNHPFNDCKWCRCIKAPITVGCDKKAGHIVAYLVLRTVLRRSFLDGKVMHPEESEASWRSAGFRLVHPSERFLGCCADPRHRCHNMVEVDPPLPAVLHVPEPERKQDVDLGSAMFADKERKVTKFWVVIIQNMIRAGASISQARAIHYATTLQALLSLGADPALKDDRGRTPLDTLVLQQAAMRSFEEALLVCHEGGFQGYDPAYFQAINLVQAAAEAASGPVATVPMPTSKWGCTCRQCLLGGCLSPRMMFTLQNTAQALADEMHDSIMDFDDWPPRPKEISRHLPGAEWLPGTYKQKMSEPFA
ncbi:hypothetical protein WJX72_001185 [[Myrmecia] bisecta]|uniref:S-acyltransferase n=1 Tax=[Myrmecia] bisecta TaxID=41462 RepID=A0AAW1QPR7_9CHLO